jgi:hypothetical protein
MVLVSIDAITRGMSKPPKMSLTSRISKEWKTALSVLGAHLGLPPNFLASTYEREATMTRPPGQQLDGKVTIPYTAGADTGTVMIWFKADEPHCISYVTVKYDFAVGADPAGGTLKWLLISGTSVRHVIKDAASPCPLYLRVSRDADGEIDAEPCCPEWQRCLDPNKPMTLVERRRFAMIDLGLLHALPTVGKSVNQARALQVRLLQAELPKVKSKLEAKISERDERIKVLQKLVIADSEEKKVSTNKRKTRNTVKIKEEPKEQTEDFSPRGEEAEDEGNEEDNEITENNENGKRMRSK